ncbi:1637_t:CDS:2 [Funneliformis caledonium]|uniref:1637_t:CDS:1 n=1 Tax=Funneliformis caledonium TaxID=1117310 RepID=A0A9N9FPC6_9GLOM|nr:1637_t:CDS:2 [Funneliformis caledonium]
MKRVFLVFFVLIITFLVATFFTTNLNHRPTPSPLPTYSPQIIDHESELKIRAQELELALKKTRIMIKNNLKDYSFPSSIPGSNIKSREEILAFREKMECITTKGKWIFDDTPREILKHKQETLYGKCDKRLQSSFDLNKKNSSIEEIWENTRNSVKYIWKPSPQCPLPNFTREDFCSLITGLKFLLVGDALSFQLHELLLDYFHDGPVQCYGQISCKEHVLCRPSPPFEDFSNLTSKMKYIRNDILSNRKVILLPEDHGIMELRNLELPWSPFSYHYNVVILNKGHHYQSDKIFRLTLINAIIKIRKNRPDTLIIFKSTTLGHQNCDDPDLKPLATNYNINELKNLPYHWDEIHKQNMIAKEIVEAAGGVYWNLEHIMESRVDGHIGGRDCLRWCIPDRIFTAIE